MPQDTAGARVRFTTEHHDVFGNMLAVEVRTEERAVDRFVVPTHYGKGPAAG